MAGWPWISGMAILGGLVGLLVSCWLPAMYRADAVLHVDLMGDPYTELSWPEKRSLLLPARALLLDDEAILPVWQTFQYAYEASSLADFRDNLRAEDIESRWHLGVIHEDPAVAAEIANAWAEAGLQVLGQARDNSLAVARIEQALREAGCQPATDALGRWAAGKWECPEAAAERFEAELSRLPDLRQKSHGVPVNLTFAWKRRAAAPSVPLYRGRGIQVVAGVGLGLILGASLTIGKGLRDPAPVKREAAERGP